MDTGNSNERTPCGGSDLGWRTNRLAERARYYFDQSPVASEDEAWLDAVGKKLYFREQRETANVDARRRATETRSIRPRLTAEDLRIHSWLFERMAAVDRERHGLWSRLRRLLFRIA